jgi:hypothetical protein
MAKNSLKALRSGHVPGAAAPVAPVMCTRSLPARSTRLSLPTFTLCIISPPAEAAPGMRPMPARMHRRLFPSLGHAPSSDASPSPFKAYEAA